MIYGIESGDADYPYRSEYMRLAAPQALTEDQFRNFIRSNPRPLVALRNSAASQGMTIEDAPSVIATFLTNGLRFEPDVEQPFEVTIAWCFLVRIVHLGTALTSKQINGMPPVALHRKATEIAGETLATHLPGVLEAIAREELAVAAAVTAIMRDAA